MTSESQICAGDDTRPSFEMRRANGAVFLTVAGPAPTVVDDGDRRPDSAADRDWFFANLDEDAITDLHLAESLTD